MLDKHGKRRLNAFEKRSRFIRTMICMVFCLVIACWVLIGIVAVKGAALIGEHGVKAVAERVWCGKNNSCL